MTKHVSRLAPSPTGALHLGNARTFLVNWAVARREGWRLLLRMEDLDGPRVKADTSARLIDTLAWLGLDHDGDVAYQSHDLEPYRSAMRRLADAGLVYACGLTRREIEQAARAPHAGEHELRFPPELRPADPAAASFDAEDTNYRIRLEPGTIAVDDVVAGAGAFDPFAEVGDFVVWTRRGAPSYQLAVVVDDARQEVTDVVRGADLLPSAARQAVLYRALDLAEPRWWHLPLVIGPDGRRLAKRHGDTRLETYRAAGVPPTRIVGLLAAWCGVVDHPVPMSAADFRDGFEMDTLPKAPVTLTPDAHEWLLAGC
jgi:glutamyl-tRNA synthetase